MRRPVYAHHQIVEGLYGRRPYRIVRMRIQGQVIIGYRAQAADLAAYNKGLPVNSDIIWSKAQRRRMVG